MTTREMLELVTNDQIGRIFMEHECDDPEPCVYAAAHALIDEVLAIHDKPVVWQVRNGVSTHGFYKSEKEAIEVCCNMQKAHDLSGSLSAFNLRPLYAKSSPVSR